MIEDPRWKGISLDGDIPVYAKDWRNDYSIWKWCRQPTLISEDEQHSWIEKIYVSPYIKMFSIVHTPTNKTAEPFFVGVCGFTSISHISRNAEFSLYIAPEYQGRGFATKALKLLLMHGFRDWNFKRIWGEVFEDNPAIEIFKKIGFVYEGTLRSSYWKQGRYIDSHMVSILDTDWVEIQAKEPTIVDNEANNGSKHTFRPFNPSRSNTVCPVIPIHPPKKNLPTQNEQGFEESDE